MAGVHDRDILASVHFVTTQPQFVTRYLADIGATVLHPKGNPGNYVTTYSANLVGLVASSFFGAGFVFFPRFFMSQYFEDVDDDAETAIEHEQGAGGDLEMTGVGATAAPTSSPNAGGRNKAYRAGGGDKQTIGPFTLLDMNGMDYFFARSIGFAILGLNLGMAIGWDGVDGIPNGVHVGSGVTYYGSLSHPLYALQVLFMFTLFLLQIAHALTMRNVTGIAHVKISWIKDLFVQVGLCIFFALAQLQDKSNN